jgi:protein gp37
MAASDIEWTDTTWNPTGGCKKVSPGCKNCYAETMAARHVLMSAAQGRESVYLPVVDAERRRWRGNFAELPERLADPLSWKKPRRVFVNSMSDLFGEGVSDEFIAAVFGVMAATPQHTYQILTKRPARMVEWCRWANEAHGDPPRTGGTMCVAAAWSLFQERGDVRAAGAVYDYWMCPRPWPLPNVWLGVSTENQETADERIPLLLEVPAAVRFISAEPLLGPILFREEWLLGRFISCPDETADPETDGCSGCEGVPSARRVDGPLSGDVCSAVRGPALAWVIVGGESGPGARECDIAWTRSIIEQCYRACVACFHKQVGAVPVAIAYDPLRGAAHKLDDIETLARIKDPKGGNPDEWPEDLRVRQWPRTDGAT